MTKEWVLLILQMACSFGIGMSIYALRVRWRKLVQQEKALCAEIAEFNERFANALELFHEGNMPAARRALLMREDQKVH